jgi:hypothetical protein
MKQFSIVVLITTLLFFCACQNNAESNEEKPEQLAVTLEKSEGDDLKGTIPPDTLKNEDPPGQQADKKKDPVTTASPKVDWDKKIVKTGSLNLEVKDYYSYYTSLREKVRNLGGYIAQEQQVQSDYKIENNMMIKIPVDQFDDAVVQLSSNVIKIVERKIHSQDVTTEVVDTRSRMETKKQVRNRYMDLLNQAKNMNEILSVQSEINGIQEQIESAAGRIQYLNHASSFSTINLTYFQVLNAAAKEPIEPRPSTFAEKIKDAFRTGWDIASNVFIGIVAIWPLLLGSAVVYLLYKKNRRARPKQIV